MNWNDFHEKYLIEVDTISSVDIQFQDNTPLHAIRKPSIRKITRARVLDKKTMSTVRDYPVTLESDDIRQVQNKLRKQIAQDFHIQEDLIPPHYSMLLAHESEKLEERRFG